MLTHSEGWMELPQDLKSYEAPDSFALFTDGEAFALLCALLGLAVLLDMLGVFA